MREVNTTIEGQMESIGNMFRILRNQNFSPREYPVVLFLLSVYKDGLLKQSKKHDQGPLFTALIEDIRNAPIELSHKYLLILESFKPTLESMGTSTLTQIVNSIYGLNKDVLSENFPEVFDRTLFQISRLQGRLGGEFLQPLELTRFICKLVDLPEAGRIYNPFAGLASFGVAMADGIKYFGQEKSHTTWALGTLRLMAYKRLDATQYVCDDSILNWPEETERFDLIVSNPPYGMRLGQVYRDIDPNIRTIEQLFIKKGVESLNATGKLIAVLPNGFLFRGSVDQVLRKQLVNDDLIDTVVSLPGGLLQNTGIPLTVLVLDKAKKLSGKVRFIEASSYVHTSNSRNSVLKDDELINFVGTSFQDSEECRIVDLEQIRKCDYNLNVPRYFQKEVEHTENEKLVQLKDLLEGVRVQRRNLPPNGKLVRISDLKNDELDCQLNISDMNEEELNRPGIGQVNESCLLMATNGQTLKPSYFEYNGKAIFLTHGIQAYKVDESIVNTQYLIHELHAEYVKEQLTTYRQGTTIPVIRTEDLMELVIKIPSLEEQKAKVKGIQEIVEKMRILQEERNALAQGVNSQLYERAAGIKHSLGKPMLNIGSALRNIEKALSKAYGNWEEVKLNERFSATIKDSFDSIHSNLELIQSIIKNNEHGLDLSKYDRSEINLLDFLKKYVQRRRATEKTNVAILLDIHPDIDIQLKNQVKVLANTQLLEIGLNAIVENADKHAFTDDTKTYTLEFRLSLEVVQGIKDEVQRKGTVFDSFAKLEVANNGKPFPKNYTLDKLIRKFSFAGDTRNTGQGGYELNEIVKYHNNGRSTLDLITDDPNTEFTTTYSFLLPLNQ